MQGIRSFKNITVAELEALLQRGCLRLLDVCGHDTVRRSLPVSEVRTDAEAVRGKIPQGVSLPLHLLPLRLNEDEKLLSGHPMDKNAATVFYCQMGGRSGQAAAFAAASGFAEVYNLQGGITAWTHAGLPIVT